MLETNTSKGTAHLSGFSNQLFILAGHFEITFTVGLINNIPLYKAPSRISQIPKSENLR